MRVTRSTAVLAMPLAARVSLFVGRWLHWGSGFRLRSGSCVDLSALD
jgi:hypothetical protein